MTKGLRTLSSSIATSTFTTSKDCLTSISPSPLLSSSKMTKDLDVSSTSTTPPVAPSVVVVVDEDNKKSNNKKTTKKNDEKKKKQSLVDEAERRGITYDQVKQEYKLRRRNKREAEALVTPEEQQQVKRLRAYSSNHDGVETKSGDGTVDSTAVSNTSTNNNNNNRRPRTRSMDIAQEQLEKQQAVQTLTVDEWRKHHNITLQDHHHHGSNNKNGQTAITTTNTNPFRTFYEAPFERRIQRIFTQAGYTVPTAIQAQSWPIALQHKDMICVAKTGSGKTCAFLLPAFHDIITMSVQQQGQTQLGQSKHPPPKNVRHGYYSNSSSSMMTAGKIVLPSLLVLAPTRELSVQIMEEAQKFGRPLGLRSVCCYGGAPKYPQLSALSRGVECLVGTPGRLNDFLEMKKLNLSNIKVVVLDEADRMLDMGFEPQIRQIIAHLPSNVAVTTGSGSECTSTTTQQQQQQQQRRQTLLFSATWPKAIQNLAHEFLHDPIQINVGQVNVLEANQDIKQHIIVCQENDKFEKLTTILRELLNETSDTIAEEEKAKYTTVAGGSSKVHAKLIVFCAKKVSCHQLANQLWDDGFAVDSLHGDRPQWERTCVMQAFREGQLRVLIATDVAARGLDVKDVGVVVNYDMPHGVNGVEDYVHRIGRTGRAGNTGVAYTFFTHNDKKTAVQLVQVLEKSKQEVPAALQAMLPRTRFTGGGGRFSGGRGRGGRSYMGGGGGRGTRGGYGGGNRSSPYSRGGRGRGGGRGRF